MNASEECLVEEVTIIGAGPAGLTTALQLKRYEISALLLEGNRIGGLLCNANLVENYPGFPGGISGQELVDLFGKQAEKIGVKVTFETVIELSRVGGLFQVVTNSCHRQSRMIVVASGTRPLTFADEMISEDIRDRIYYEVHPLMHWESKRIAIVGAGDAAFDYALNLAKKNEVLVLNRGKQVKCLPLLWERAVATSHIQYRPQVQVSRCTRNPSEGISLECNGPYGKEVIEADFLIGAIGREPCLDFLTTSLREQVHELECSGVLHMVGDVKNGLLRQTAIAVGEGLRAAMKIYQYLKESVQ